MHLSNYAEDGLRTMLFAYKKIDEMEYETWNSQFMKAKATIGSEREELIENASDIIENNLYLLGAVAVDDKLQNGVSSLSLLFSPKAQIFLTCTDNFIGCFRDAPS